MSTGLHDERRADTEPDLVSPDVVAREYDALRAGAMLVDRSARARATFAGAGTAEVLTGLVTNDVLALSPGSGQYAAALSPKGKILADMRIFAREADFLVDLPPRAAEGWWAMIRKYVNPRIARYADVSATLRDIGVFGARATELVSRVTGLDAEGLASLAAYGHHRLERGGERVLVARVPDLGLEGYELLAPPEAVETLWSALVDAGATPASAAAYDVARIEAGRPEWGLDMDDSNLAQEANLDELGAISYTKGCYTGQETVARVHFRGHVNRLLRGLRFGQGPVPARGAAVTGADDRPLGDVRSVAVSPRLGGVALAMIRREVDAGTTVRCGAPATAPEGMVTALPFPM
jgi:folate-binding protein YgfZ